MKVRLGILSQREPDFWNSYVPQSETRIDEAIVSIPTIPLNWTVAKAMILELGEEEAMYNKQVKFSRMVAQLINKAFELGHEVTLGHAYRTPEECKRLGFPKSLHGKRLAIDINLFKDGEYLTSTEDHRALGEWWESIGGTWGGRFDDGNHYSLEHGGVK